MSYSVHVDNKKKDTLILGEGSTQGLDGATLTAEKNYSINFRENNKKFCLSLHYDGANSYLFVNGTEIIKFKAKDSETAAAPLCIGKISKYISVDNKKKTGLNGYVFHFSIEYNVIAVGDKLDIHKHLMKTNDITWNVCVYYKIYFYNNDVFGCNVLSVNLLKCISMND